MDVPALGANPTPMEFFSAISRLAGPKAALAALDRVVQSGDTITAMLGQISEPAALILLEIIENRLPPENAARLEGLMRAAVTAANEGNVQRALSNLAKFAALDPRRAETLESEHGVVSIRPEVRRLLSRLAAAAYLDAESRLGRATQLLEAAASRELPGQELRPEIVIMIAGRFQEAGGYANWIRSAELSQMAINAYAFAPIPAPIPLAARGRIRSRYADASLGSRRRWAPQIRMLWRRDPLLVLLLAWLALGILGGSASAIWRSGWPQTWPQSLSDMGFDVWGIGFLAQIGLGFYARIRNWRSERCS